MILDDVLRFLDSHEPDYPKAASELGLEALPFLVRLIEEGDPMRAPQAAYLASFFDSAEATNAVRAAAASPAKSVRGAVAAGLPRLPGPISEELVRRLLDDSEASVRRTCLRSLSSSSDLRLRVEPLALDTQIRNLEMDPSPSVRRLAGETLELLGEN